jgi:ATP-dependent DNA helicase RecQ
MQGKPLAEQEIGKQLLFETVAYAESSVCRPKLLLNYFGEIMPGQCDNCDNCLHPKEKIEGSDYMVMALEAIAAVKEKFKADHIANILAGNINSAIKSYKHHKLFIFGTGGEKDTKFWNAVLRQAMVAGLIQKDIENYGLLRITDKGKEFLEKPDSFMITLDHDYDVTDEQAAGAPGGVTSTVDEELFRILKDLRKKISKKINLPPFVIFQDPSLEDMAIQYPITMDELQNIQGVGAGKAQRYGKEFIELIKTYVDEKEIIRPQDMVVRSVINKSGLKVYIIQSIDRKMSLEDIAEAKNLEMNDLLKEIEAIVNSGTKLNINYYINQVMDEEHQEEVYEYFREAETESIQNALDELGEDEYTEEDIRLIRIRFLSEMGH